MRPNLCVWDVKLNQSRMGSRNHVLDVGTYWRQLANTTKRSMRGGDAALCQITLTTCCLGGPILGVLGRRKQQSGATRHLKAISIPLPYVRPENENDKNAFFR